MTLPNNRPSQTPHGKRTREADCVVCGFLALYYGIPDNDTVPSYLCVDHRDECRVNTEFRQLPALGLDYV